MPEVKGFRAFRFDPKVAGSYDDTITPPYDVINPSQRAELMARSPFNICLLYTSDAADDLLCVDLGGRRIIKKKTIDTKHRDCRFMYN